MTQIVRKKLIVIVIVLKRDRGECMPQVMEAYFRIAKFPADPLKMVINSAFFARIPKCIRKYQSVLIPPLTFTKQFLIVLDSLYLTQFIKNKVSGFY